MSTKSRETHIRVPQDEVMLWMECLLYDGRVEHIEITDVPENKQVCEQLELDPNISLCVVSPTDENGWTVIWSDYYGPIWGETLTQQLSEYTQALAVFGDYHDGTGWWEWSIYHNGQLQAHYSSSQAEGQRWYEYGEGERPAEAMWVEDAFASLGRIYRHFPFHLDSFQQGGTLFCSGQKAFIIHLQPRRR